MTEHDHELAQQDGIHPDVYEGNMDASMTAVHEEIEIVPMKEFEAGPQPFEYYARGHHDKQQFLDEVRNQYDPWHELEGKQIQDNLHHYVRHEYWRAVPTGLEECPFTYFVSAPGRGAFPVTVVDA